MGLIGAPGGLCSHDLRLKGPLFYLAELRAHDGCFETVASNHGPDGRIRPGATRFTDEYANYYTTSGLFNVC